MAKDDKNNENKDNQQNQNVNIKPEEDLEQKDFQEVVEKDEILVSHYLDEKGFLLQRRGDIYKHLDKKSSDKASRKWLDSKIKSYKGEK